MRTELLWATGAAVVGGYLLLFVLARRPVTLRLVRLGCLLAILLGLRLVLTTAAAMSVGGAEGVATGLLGVAAAILVLARRVWLVRTTGEELRDQIQSACRGLFLRVEEAPVGRLQLKVQGNPRLRVRRLASRVQLLVLCPVAGPGKVALLCNWLAKQYPGPVPRMRFILKGGAT